MASGNQYTPRKLDSRPIVYIKALGLCLVNAVQR